MSGMNLCQECGGHVHIEVSWDHWGVDTMHLECADCGHAGTIQPQPAEYGRTNHNAPEGHGTLEEFSE
jgi:hypothetical protein